MRLETKWWEELDLQVNRQANSFQHDFTGDD
jgi:hypothetical protein